jgi:hypothetical protein
MLILKAVMPSLVLTIVVSAILASSGATAGFLNIQDAAISGHAFHWSWPLFLVGSAFSWGLLLMMD